MKEVSITVLMPVYNAEKWLQQAIESILKQTFKNFEFLIIDDGSTDKSVQMIESYDDKRIRLIKNNENQGLIFTLNLGLKLASGKYIARMDADDIALPERLEKQFNFMNKNNEIVLSGTYAKMINENGKYIKTMYSNLSDNQLRAGLYFFNDFIHSSSMFIRHKVIEVNGYDKRNIHAEDYGLWAKLSKIGKLANIPEILLEYRWHEENISNQKQRIQQESVFDISYNFLNEAIKGNLDKNSYHRFWCFWRTHEGAVTKYDIKALIPLWDFAANLPEAKYVLLSMWYYVVCRMILSGNISTGLYFLKILQQKFNIISNWKIIFMSAKLRIIK